MQKNITRLTEKNIEKIIENELGEQYRLYRSVWNSFDGSTPLDFPIHIDFELNDLCNQSCIMCPRNTNHHPDIDYPINTKTTLDVELFKKAIDEGVPLGLRSITLGAFAEPLVNNKVIELLNYAHDKGVIDSRLITNGLLLGKYSDQILKSNLVNLFVSLDAMTEETHYKIRGGGLNRITQNLLDFVEKRNSLGKILPIVRVSFVDMKINEIEKKEFIEYWNDRVDFIDIQSYDNYNVSYKKQFDLTLAKKWDCKAPWVRVSILANGDILPCCNFFGRNIPIGNLKTTTISQAWNGAKMQEVRQGVLKDTNNNCSACQRSI